MFLQKDYTRATLSTEQGYNTSRIREFLLFAKADFDKVDPVIDKRIFFMLFFYSFGITPIPILFPSIIFMLTCFPVGINLPLCTLDNMTLLEHAQLDLKSRTIKGVQYRLGRSTYKTEDYKLHEGDLSENKKKRPKGGGDAVYQAYNPGYSVVYNTFDTRLCGGGTLGDFTEVNRFALISGDIITSKLLDREIYAKAKANKTKATRTMNK